MSVDFRRHQSICAELYHLPSDLNNIAPRDCRFCAAYAQGREDLADQIRTAVAPFYDSPHGKYLAPLMSKIRTILIGIEGR